MEDLNLTPQEKVYFKTLFQAADGDKDGKIGFNEAGFLQKSGLPKLILGQIWGLADSKTAGSLNESEFYLALRLIALAQQNKEVKREAALKSSGLPSFPDFPPPAVPAPAPTPSEDPNSLVITPSEKDSYSAIFDKVDANHDGFVTGGEARELFSKSGLPTQDLAKIWTLSDINQDHQLDREEFIIAMTLINAKLKNKIKEIPATLPPSLVPKKGGSGGAQPSTPAPTSSPSTPSAPADPNAIGPITQEDRVKYFDIFKRGAIGSFVSGDQARKLFSKSGLPNEDLGKIWALSDIDKDSKLNEDEFAIAMHLINQKLKGKQIPSELPPFLKPGGAAPSSPKPAPNYDLDLSAISPKPAPVQAPIVQPVQAPIVQPVQAPIVQPVQAPIVQQVQAQPQMQGFGPNPTLSPVLSPHLQHSGVVAPGFGVTGLPAPSPSPSVSPTTSLTFGNKIQDNKKDELAKDLQQMQLENEQLAKQTENEKQELERLTGEVRELEKLVEEEKTKKIGYKEQLKYIQLNLKTVQEQKEHFDRILKEKSESLSEETELLNNFQQELKNKTQELESVQNQIQTLSHELDDLRNKRKQVRQELTTVKSELATAQEKKRQLTDERDKEKEAIRSNPASPVPVHEPPRGSASPSVFSSSQPFSTSFSSGGPSTSPQPQEEGRNTTSSPSFGDAFGSSPFQPFGNTTSTPFDSFGSTSQDFGTEDPFSFSSDLKGPNVVDTQADTFGDNSSAQNNKKVDLFASTQGFGFGGEFDDTGKEDFG